MTDPFSKSLRKYITPDRYQILFEEISRNALINKDLSTLSESVIKLRIRELEQWQQKEGFVFVGEHPWLNSFLLDPSVSLYSLWVDMVFRDFLGVDFAFVDFGAYQGLPDKCWKTVLEKPGRYLPCFDQLMNVAFEPAKDITHVEIHVYGPEEGPGPMHLSRAFEFLFDLEYMIALLPEQVGEGGWVGIEGLDVVYPGHPEKWELIVRSGYGAEFDYAFDNRKPC